MSTPQQDLAEQIAKLTSAQREEFYARMGGSVGGNVPESPTNESPINRFVLSPLGKILDVLDTGENMVTLGLRPIVTGINPALESVYEEKGANVLASDLVEAGIPGRSIIKGVLKFGADIAADPLTYTGFGLATKTGRIKSIAKGLATEDKTIDMTSKLAHNIAEIYHMDKPSVDAIRQAKKGVAPTLAGQARLGERALVQVGIPFTDKEVTLVKGAKVFEGIDKLRQMVRDSNAGQAFNTLFSTSSGHPEFDALRAKFVNLLRYRQGAAVATARAYNDQIDELVIKLAKPDGTKYTREELNKMLTDMVERPSLLRRTVQKVVHRAPVDKVDEIKREAATAFRALGDEETAAKLEKMKSTDPRAIEIFKLAKKQAKEDKATARLFEGVSLADKTPVGRELARDYLGTLSHINRFKGGVARFSEGIMALAMAGSEQAKLIDAATDTLFNESNKLITLNSRSKYLRKAFKQVGHFVTSYDRYTQATLSNDTWKLAVQDLTDGKVTVDAVIRDIFKVEEPPKYTTKTPNPLTLLGGDDELASVKYVDRSIKTAEYNLNKRGVTAVTGEGLIDYFATHFYRPIKNSGVTGGRSMPKQVAMSRRSTGVLPQIPLRGLRRGQLAEFLRTSRGDIYQRISNLVNAGVMDNRELLPNFADGLLDGKIVYNEREVLVDRLRRNQHSYPESGVVPRSVFEHTVSDFKNEAYATNQFLPVIHGVTTGGAEGKIVKEGLVPQASRGLDTKAHDYLKGLMGKIFATAAKNEWGSSHVYLPVRLLEKATALPGDGVYLPANKLIINHILARGEDGILDMLVRRGALFNWDGLQAARQHMKTDPEALSKFLSEVSAASEEIHITGPISPDQFVGMIPHSPAVPTIEALRSVGLNVDQMQLIKRNGRYFTKFLDKTGAPLIDIELLGTPNIAKLLGKKNMLGVDIGAEQTAAAVEDFIKKSAKNVPQGESVYTHMRANYPEMFSRGVESVHSPEFEQILENYGLLSDKSIEAIAANIIDIPNSTLHRGGITAAALISNPDVQKKILSRVVINGERFESVLKDIPQYTELPIEERMNASKLLWRMVKIHEKGHDVFTVGVRMLPQELHDEWPEIVSKMSKLDVALPRNGKKGVTPAKWAEAFRLYSRGGVISHETPSSMSIHMVSGQDRAIHYLLGEKEFNRISKIPSDLAFMRSVVTKMASYVDELFSEAFTLYHVNPKGLQRRWPESYAFMRKLFARQGWKTEFLESQVHVPRKWAVRHPEMADFMQRYRREQQQILQAELNSGVETAEWTGKNIEYILHYPTKQVRELLGKSGFDGSAKEWTGEHASQLARKLQIMDMKKLNESGSTFTERQLKALRSQHGIKYLNALVKDGVISGEASDTFRRYLTVTEVNALARQGKLRILGTNKVDKFFEENPATLLAVRGLRGARAATGKEFFDAVRTSSLKEGYGVKITAADTVPEGFAFTKVEELKGVAFPEEVASLLDKHFEALKFPAGMHPLLDIFDNVQDIWKVWTLAIFPAYHTRNIVGNLWNNFLAGLVNPKYYHMAMGVQQGKGAGLVTGYGEKFTAQQLQKLVGESGFSRSGQYFGDFEKEFSGDVAKVLSLSRATDNPVINTGLKWGDHIETNAKVAHFLWRLEQGYSPAAAAQSVRKYLFDYTDLTEFEKNVMRRVFPFYTWTRKNVPIQVEALITQPGKAAGVLKAKHAVESSTDGVPDERILPDWMVQNFPIRVRKNARGNHEYFLLGSWLPLADIDKIFAPHRLAMNMLTPLLKEPMQQLFNKDVYSGREIDRGSEYERIAGINLPKRLTHVLKNVRAVSEVDKLTKDDSDAVTKAIALVTGKLYPFDEEKERQNKDYQFSGKERNLKGQLKRARKKGDESEVERVKKELAKNKQKEREVVGGGA